MEHRAACVVLNYSFLWYMPRSANVSHSWQVFKWQGFQNLFILVGQKTTCDSLPLNHFFCGQLSGTKDIHTAVHKHEHCPSPELVTGN